MCAVEEGNLGKSGMHLFGERKIKYPLVVKDSCNKVLPSDLICLSQYIPPYPHPPPSLPNILRILSVRVGSPPPRRPQNVYSVPTVASSLAFPPHPVPPGGTVKNVIIIVDVSL